MLYLLCFFRVCDVITPEVEIGGQFRKDYRNGTLISYNLDRYGFCVPPKVTILWTKILLEYVFLGRNGYSEVALYIFLTPTCKDRSTIFLQNDCKRLIYEFTKGLFDGISCFWDIWISSWEGHSITQWI